MGKLMHTSIPASSQFLQPNRYIDSQHPDILALAGELARGCATSEEIGENCFEFVRDQIQHSWDYQMNPITCRASDVLKYRTGFCYAKSHLLAALLRANKIPAALCYQRLTISDDKPPFCLHGLNAIYLENHGWYRIDARGNKPGVAAEFCPPQEKLAFPIISKGEADIPGFWSEPLPQIVDILERAETYLDVANNLPDLENW